MKKINEVKENEVVITTENGTKTLELFNEEENKMTKKYTVITNVDQDTNVQPLKTVTITENGETLIEPDEGYEAVSLITASVNVPTPEPNLEEKEVDITEQGEKEFLPSEGYDGISSIKINVQVQPQVPERYVLIHVYATTTGIAAHGICEYLSGGPGMNDRLLFGTGAYNPSFTKTPMKTLLKELYTNKASNGLVMPVIIGNNGDGRLTDKHTKMSVGVIYIKNSDPQIEMSEVLYPQLYDRPVFELLLAKAQNEEEQNAYTTNCNLRDLEDEKRIAFTYNSNGERFVPLKFTIGFSRINGTEIGEPRIISFFQHHHIYSEADKLNKYIRKIPITANAGGSTYTVGHYYELEEIDHPDIRLSSIWFGYN